MDNIDFVGAVTDRVTDAEVISRVLGGEKDLYAVIMRRYNARLYRVAISIIKDDAEVEDVMQSAYVKAYENLGKFESKSDFSTWLTRILINECYLKLRKYKYVARMNETIMEQDIKRYNTDNSTPAVQLQNNELKKILEDAILALPEKYRTVFIMREVENMNVAETKACLQISGINVKVRLNRAKALLRKSLKVFYQNEDIFNFHLLRCNKTVATVLSKI